MPDNCTWICSVCGYVHRGPEPPDECPVCGVGPEDFEAGPAEAGGGGSSPAAGESCPMQDAPEMRRWASARPLPATQRAVWGPVEDLLTPDFLRAYSWGRGERRAGRCRTFTNDTCRSWMSGK